VSHNVLLIAVIQIPHTVYIGT